MIESEGCGGNRSSAPGLFLKLFLLLTFAYAVLSCYVLFLFTKTIWCSKF